MALITIDDTTPRIAYTATAAQETFTVPFAFFDDADLVVSVDGTTKTLTTDYTVLGAGEEDGGSITFETAMTGGEAVVIYSDIAIERATAFPTSGAFSIPSLNQELTRLYAIQKQLYNLVARTFRLADNDESDNVNLPVAADRANKFISFDTAGDVSVSAGTTDTPVSAFMATVLDDADADAAKTTLGIPDVSAMQAVFRWQNYI